MAAVQSQSTKLCSHCLPDCNHIAYSTSTTSAEFRCEIKSANLNLSSLSRRCDSRNLNLSPFCGLDSSSAPLKLQPTVEAAYGSVDTNYVQDMSSPMRKEYPLESMASNEILTSLVQVKVWSRLFIFQKCYHLPRIALNTTHMTETSPLSTFSLLIQLSLVCSSSIFVS